MPPAGKTGWPWTTPFSDTSSLHTSYASLITSHSSRSEFPRVSLVMPCLNASPYIEEALRSLLLQGYPDLELMVFDGGSTDGTVEIIKRYASWLAYWVSEKDRGQSHAINKGLEKVTGEWFNWFNADDVMCVGSVKAMVEMGLTNRNCVGVCGSMLNFEEDGKESIARPVPGNKEQLGNWVDPYFLPQPSSLYATNLCRRVGGVNEKLYYTMDMELVLKLADLGEFAVVDRVITRFRCHEKSKTTHCYYGGLLEMLVTNFNFGQVQVAEEMLRRRMDGHARLVIGMLNDEDVAKMVDGWGYAKVARYLIRRLWKNILLRVSL